MGWKTTVFVIFVIILSAFLVTMCSVFMYKDFKQSEGEPAPTLYTKHMFIKTQDKLTNEYIDADLLIVENNASRTISTHSTNFEEIDLSSIHKISAYGGDININWQSCDMTKAECIIQAYKKGNITMETAVKKIDAYNMEIDIRLSCIGGFCEKSRICYNSKKEKINIPLEIIYLKRSGNEDTHGLGEDYCFEQEFSEDGVIDFTLEARFFKETNNEFIRIEVFDNAYSVNGAGINEFYTLDGKDAGKENMRAVIYPYSNAVYINDDIISWG